MLLEEELTGKILGAAIEVHKVLGPGLLESVYESCLCYELRLRGISFERQVELPIVYKGVALPCSFRIDIIVENAVLIELKAIERLLAIHEAQLLTYLRLSGKRVGFVMNFNVAVLRHGIARKIL